MAVLMRFYPPSKRHYDLDNLLASMKAGLDGMADALGVDDNIFRPSIEVMAEVRGMVVVEVSIK